MSIVVKCPACGTKNRLKDDPSRTPKCGKCKAPILLQQLVAPVQLSDNDFDNFIQTSRKPVLVDFWATWCAPCRMMSPVLETFAQSQTSITVAKLDTQHNPVMPSRFRIFSIPTLILFEKGQEVHRITGAVNLNELESQLRPWITVN